MKKIFWTDDEKRKLCEVGADIRKMHIGMTPSYLRILNQAQKEAISVERRRKIVAITPAMKWFEVGVESICNQKKREAELVAKRPVNPPIAEIKTEELIDEILKRIFDGRTGKLADAIANRVMEQMRSLVQGMITSQLSKLVISHGEQKPADKKKVLIVGLQPDQIAEVEKTYNDFFDLRFARDRSDNRLKDLAASSDTLILMTKFISHHHQESAKSAFPGKVTYCHGGMSDLDKKLSEIADQ